MANKKALSVVYPRLPAAAKHKVAPRKAAVPIVQAPAPAAPVLFVQVIEPVAPPQPPLPPPPPPLPPPIIETPPANIVTISGFYADKDASRTDEMVECVRRNVANRHVAEVHVFIEDGVATSHASSLFGNDKIVLVEHGSRVRFDDLFRYANQNLAGKTVAIVNADIFFDETISGISLHDLDGAMLCLSRWDETPDGPVHFGYEDSQDAWIFRSPIREFQRDWYLGLMGCDRH